MPRKKGSTESWKEKKWFHLIAPKGFNEVILGETIARKPEQVMDRKIFVNMQSLTRDIKKSHIDLVLQVKKIEGLKAFTELKGFQVNSSYMKRIVRRRVSKIEVSQTVQLKDGFQYTVKTIAVTMRKCHRNQETLINNVLRQEVDSFARQKSAEEFINHVLLGNFAMKIFNKVKKIVPVKRVEVIKATELSKKTSSQAQ
ncbi:hypothetical protein HZB89_01240 [archaeon]|nr:hypothetical protein [archaeon]